MMKKIMFAFLAVLLAVGYSQAFAATIAYYTFEEGTDGSGALGTAPTTSGWVLDSAGSLNGTASVQGSDPQYVAAGAKVPGDVALAFGTARNYVNLGNHNEFQWWEGAGRTLEFFVRRDGDGPDASAEEFVMSKDYTSHSGWQIAFDRSNGLLTFNINGNAVTSTTDFRDSDWHHVAITHVASSGRYDLYVDYQPESSLTGYTGGSVSNDNFKLGVGAGWQSPRVFVGALDNVRFSDQALSPSEFVQFVPEPLSMLLLGLGGVLLSWKRR